MTTYFVASGGSNTSPYDTWAKAATSLQTALTAATADGDIVVVQYNAVPSGDAELAADTVYTLGAGDILVISASNDGGSAWTYTAMGTANWIGNSTTNRSVTMFSTGDRQTRLKGLTLRTAGSTSDSITLGSNTSNGAVVTAENCYFWAGNTTASILAIQLGSSSASVVECINCTFRLGATTQNISINGDARLYGCTISSSGSTPTTLFAATSTTNTGMYFEAHGCDFSLVTGTLFGNAAITLRAVLDRCKLGSGVTVLASQTTNPTQGSMHVTALDCNSGDTHTFHGYYNALGSVVSDTGIYLTAGAAAQSWKVVTNSNASEYGPFCTPWFSVYHSGTSAITPYVEIARDGSTTAYTDAEVWAEWQVKDQTGTVLTTWKSDRAALGAAGSSQATGAGTGSWTGLSGTAWSGKCDSGASVTPAEVGDLSVRLCVGASKTVYMDPQIRT